MPTSSGISGSGRPRGNLSHSLTPIWCLPPDRLSRAVRLLLESEVDCVAGVMRSVRDDLLGRFVDGNALARRHPGSRRRTLSPPRSSAPRGPSRPITADILFTRRMYEDCPIDSSWSHGSLEDYEWFWRVVKRGHELLVSSELFGWHHHRSGLRDLTREYRRSARGCAYFIRAHRDSPFARKRMTQAIVLPVAAFGALLGIAAATYTGQGELAGRDRPRARCSGHSPLSARESPVREGWRAF